MKFESLNKIRGGGGGYNIIRSLSLDKDQNNTVCDIIIEVHSVQTNMKIPQSVMSLYKFTQFR